MSRQNWRQNNFHFGSHCHFSDDNWKYYWWINQWSGMVTIVVGHISASFGVKDVTWTYFILGFALVTIAQVGYLAMFAMLFHGIKEDRHGFMLPFLIFGMISLVVSYFKSCKFWTIIKFKRVIFILFTDFNYIGYLCRDYCKIPN